MSLQTILATARPTREAQNAIDQRGIRSMITDRHIDRDEANAARNSHLSAQQRFNAAQRQHRDAQTQLHQVRNAPADNSLAASRGDDGRIKTADTMQREKAALIASIQANSDEALAVMRDARKKIDEQTAALQNAREGD